MPSSRTRNLQQGHRPRQEGHETREGGKPRRGRENQRVRQTPREPKARAREKRRPRPATPGTTTMGPVLAYHQVPPAKEGFKEPTSAQSAGQLDTLHANVLRRKADHRKRDWQCGTSTTRRRVQGVENSNFLQVPPIWNWARSRSPRRRRSERDENDDKEDKRENRRSRSHRRPGSDNQDKAEFNGKLLTLDLYLMKRRFFFLHLYSGPQDPLGSALTRAARRHKMKVTVESFDRDRDGVDLLAEEPYTKILGKARNGQWDGYHAGFPGTSFPKLRWREMKGYPGPCRSRRYYGLPDKTEARQAECDQGTLDTSRSMMMGEVILNSRPEDRIKPAVTVENPPPSDHTHHCSVPLRGRRPYPGGWQGEVCCVGALSSRTL